MGVALNSTFGSKLKASKEAGDIAVLLGSFSLIIFCKMSLSVVKNVFFICTTATPLPLPSTVIMGPVFWACGEVSDPKLYEDFDVHLKEN